MLSLSTPGESCATEISVPRQVLASIAQFLRHMMLNPGLPQKVSEGARARVANLTGEANVRDVYEQPPHFQDANSAEHKDADNSPNRQGNLPSRLHEHLMNYQRHCRLPNIVW